jgi:hypothetical protein
MVIVYSFADRQYPTSRLRQADVSDLVYSRVWYHRPAGVRLDYG